jgi:hypothetical protein
MQQMEAEDAGQKGKAVAGPNVTMHKDALSQKRRIFTRTNRQQQF